MYLCLWSILFVKQINISCVKMYNEKKNKAYALCKIMNTFWKCLEKQSAFVFFSCRTQQVMWLVHKIKKKVMCSLEMHPFSVSLANQRLLFYPKSWPFLSCIPVKKKKTGKKGHKLRDIWYRHSDGSWPEEQWRRTKWSKVRRCTGIWWH